MQGTVLCKEAHGFARRRPFLQGGAARHPGRKAIVVTCYIQNVSDFALEARLQALRPAIILVEPQIGENIGSAARAMKNFGLSDLRLVNPRDGWPNPVADATASHAVDLLRSARLYGTLEEAVADLDQVYAATARTRFMSKAFVTSRQLPADLQKLAEAATQAAAAAAAAAQAAALGAAVGPAASAGASLTYASEGPPTAVGLPSTGGSPAGTHAGASDPAPSAAAPRLGHPQPQSRAAPESGTTQTLQEQRQPSAPPHPAPEPAASVAPSRAECAAAAPSPLASLVAATPPAAAPLRPPRAGVLFGRESSGLTNEEVALANKVLTIEADPAYPVLNMAQAIVCTAYELHHARLDAAGAAVGTGAGAGVASASASAGAARDPANATVAGTAAAAAAVGSLGRGELVAGGKDAVGSCGEDAASGTEATAGTDAAVAEAATGSGARSSAVASSAAELRDRAASLELATRGDVENFLRRLVSELDAVRFFESEEKRPATLLSMRNLVGKAERLTRQEVALLHGMLTKLVSSRQR